MTMKFRYTLPILAAFLFLGLATTANARKPASEMSLYAGPIRGVVSECSFTNHSDADIVVDVSLYCARFSCFTANDFPPLGDPINYDQLRATGQFTVEPGQTEGIGDVSFATSLIRCVVNYVGYPSDIKGTLCVENINGPQTLGCTELN